MIYKQNKYNNKNDICKFFFFLLLFGYINFYGSENSLPNKAEREREI